jgi:hypothetical protein
MTGMEVFMAAASAIGTLASARNQASAQNTAAEIAAQQAERERQIAAQQAEDFRRRQDAALAAERARRAGSGVALAGSPLLADDAAVQDIALGAARIRSGGEAQATRLDAQAAASRGRADSVVPLGALRAGTTLLKGFNTAFF